MTLVCAPAGYGKSVTVSQWSETLDRPVAWLSLDSSIDDPRPFLAHLVAAVQTIEPEAMATSAQIASAGELATVNTIVTELGNELDQLHGRIVVVLDDYHAIASSEVQRIMADLLRHPPKSVHFVVITRQEPALPVAVLRARGQLIELRMTELAFDLDEVRQLSTGDGDVSTPEDAVRDLHTRTEGWPVGIRLAIEGSRLSGDIQLVGPDMLDRRAQEYIVSEVLSRLPTEVHRGLILTSLFDRFDAELFDAALTSTASGAALMNGVEFIDWLEAHNLFLVPLDEKRAWFRFHHLFGDLLERLRPAQLSELGASEIEVRRAAAVHFESRDMAWEAIEQLLMVGDHPAAADLAATHGDRLIEEERWAELEALLHRMPADIADNDPALLVLKAWLLGDFRCRHREMTVALDRAENLLDGRREEGDGLLRGQIAGLRGAYENLLLADFDGAVAQSATARQLLAASPGRHLVFAHILGVLAHAGAGRIEEARRLSNSVMGDPRFADAPFDPTSWALPYLGWMEGDLALEERHAAHLLTIGERFGLQDTIASAHYFLGTAAYERNNLDDAEFHLNKVIAHRFATPAINSFHAGVALSFVRLAQGRSADADAIAKETAQHVLDTRSEYLAPVADAFLAEVDLRQGRPQAAERWARSAPNDAPHHAFMYFDPDPTRAKVVLGSPADMATASAILDETLERARSRHNVPTTIRLLAISALHLDACGEDDRARAALTSAVMLAHEGGIVRGLADLGPRLAPLLQRLDVTGDALNHIGAILAAITPPRSQNADAEAEAEECNLGHGGPALTRREVDVLTLLATRQTNKEIARDLLVAPATVKKHTISLYEKLNVHGRREAVTKATALGYLSAER